MTDQELDRIMERVLIDSLKLDWEKAAQEEIPFEPSSQHQRQMRAMLANPLRWVRRRERPGLEKMDSASSRHPACGRHQFRQSDGLQFYGQGCCAALGYRVV